MITLGPRCSFCKHYCITDPGTCKAFPDMIPNEILSGKEEHLVPREDDHGVQFELDPYLSKAELAAYRSRFEKTDD